MKHVGVVLVVSLIFSGSSILGQTIGEFNAMTATQKHDALAAVARVGVASLSSHTKNDGSEKTTTVYEADRKLANLTRALFGLGDFGSDGKGYDVIPRAAVVWVKKDEKNATRPLSDIVAAYVGTFYKKHSEEEPANRITEAKSDNVQQYLWVMTVLKMDAEENVERATELQNRIQRDHQEAECRTIRLRDGREAYVDGKSYVDENHTPLQGADLEYAQQQREFLRTPDGIKAYHECLAAHGINQ